jgi:PAS domain S-box-containing protein
MIALSILHVDHDKCYLELAKLFLEQDGMFRVESISDCRSALERLQAGSYDAILADSRAPEEDCIELLKVLRVQGMRTPFILVTSRGREDLVSNAFRNGADLYMYKNGDSRVQFTELGNMVRLLVERSQAEHRLNESDLMYRTVFEATGAATVVIGEDAVLERVNSGFERLTGYTREEVEGKMHALVFVAPEDHDRVADYYERRRADPEAAPKSYEVRILTKDGRARHTVATIGSVPASHRTVGSFVDISSHKDALVRLSESESRFRTLAEHMEDIVYIYRFRPEPRFEYINRACETMTGYAPEEHYSDPSIVFRIVHPADHEKLRAVQESPESVSWPAPIRWIAKDGRILWTEQRMVFIEGPSGKGELLIGIVRDVTDRRNAEEALLQANRRLNLLATATRHDALNQLSVLVGYLQIAGDTATEPSVREFIDLAMDASMELKDELELTADYRELGANQSTWVDAYEACTRCVSRLKLDGTDVVVDLQGLELYADPLIERVFLNLMENSRRHNESVTRVRFRYEDSPDGLLLEYEDDGCGIPAEHKERIFEKGFGTHTGYGLFMAREVLSITGITIKETGVDGEGARFEIRVPKGRYRFAQQGSSSQLARA